MKIMLTKISLLRIISKVVLSEISTNILYTSQRRVLFGRVHGRGRGGSTILEGSPWTMVRIASVGRVS